MSVAGIGISPTGPRRAPLLRLRRGRADTTMYECRVDPVRYAWERCNVGVSFPEVLARGLGPLPSALSLSSPWRTPNFVQAVAGVATVRAALHSLIVGPRTRPKALP